MRLTIQFGPWSPDLANVPFQYSDQPGPVIVPVADCLNVYYANGTYKSIASPSKATINGSVVASLPSQVLNAFSFFDNVQQQKSIFAGQPGAVYQLNTNGTWTSIAFFNNNLQINLNSASFWSFGAMGPYIFAIPYTPISNMTGPYLWSDQGLSNNGNTFSQPTGAPGGRIGAAVAQFLMVGDILSAQTQVIGTGDGSTINFSALLSNTPMLSAGSVYDSNNTISGIFNNGIITGTGLIAPPSLPGINSTLNALGDVYTFPGGVYLYSTFALNIPTDPTRGAFASITVNGTTFTTGASAYSYTNGVATWIWTPAVARFGMVAGTIYPVSFVPSFLSTTIIAGTSDAPTNGYAPYTIAALQDIYPAGVYGSSQFILDASNDPGSTIFNSISANGVTKTSASASYSYSGGQAKWTWTSGAFGFVSGSTYPVTFVGAIFFSTLTAGTFTFHPGGTIQTGFSTGLIGSSSSTAQFTGFQQSSNTGEGAGQSSINYTTGQLELFLSGIPAVGDTISVSYTQCAPYRVWWSAIGDPTNFPTPLTASAVAFQSGFQDLNAAQGPVMFIAGFPLYGIIFQLTGITVANYVGGNVVFSFALYSQNRGLIAHGAAIQVGTLVYFLSQDGFFVTNGASVSPIGTDGENDAGIDNWFWANVNQSALSAISCGYDDTTRCVYFAIPTGVNILPDTLLTYNPIANRWTRAKIATELIFTDDNGSTVEANEIRLGLFTQAHQYSSLLGATLLGHIESCDLMPVDAMYRTTTAIRPNVACTDIPKAKAGFRNSMQDSVTYTPASVPDPFSRVVPVLQNGLYTRAHVSSSAASAINGATLEQQSGGSV